MKKIIITIDNGVICNVYSDIDEEIKVLVGDYAKGEITEEFAKELEGTRVL